MYLYPYRDGAFVSSCAQAVYVLQGIVERWTPAHENEDDVNVAIPSQGRREPSFSPGEAAIEVPHLLDMEGFQIKQDDSTLSNTTAFQLC